MNRPEALVGLTATETERRLDSARWLADNAELDDWNEVYNAFLRESVPRIRDALRSALDRIDHAAQPPARATDSGDRLGGKPPTSVEAMTKQVVHELQAILGVLRLHGREDIDNYPESRLSRDFDRLEGLMRAINRLGRASASPSIVEFDLSEVVRQCANAERDLTGYSFELAGPEHVTVLGDPDLVEMVLRNAMRNAVDASLDRPSADSREPVVVTWGRSERDQWVFVVDWGIGLPPNAEKIFDLGVSNKKDHSGTGLAIARGATESLRGTLNLVRRAEGGCRFEFRWPRNLPELL